MMHIRLTLAFTIAALVAGAVFGRGVLADDLNDGEKRYRAIAVSAVPGYDQPWAYTYQPRADSRERAAVLVAVTAQVLLEGYRETGRSSWLDHAKIAADTLLAHGDMNGDGKLGWGRYWPNTEAYSDGKGGHTSFGGGCTLSSNRRYDDEMYDNAKITDFLLDLYSTVPDGRYLDAARSVMENTWSVGSPVYGDGFMYWKTAGACSHSWYVKNINMLMAMPMARLAKVTRESRYADRLQAMMKAELHDIRRTVSAHPAPNFGYFALKSMEDRRDAGAIVQSFQAVTPDGSISCKTRSRACIEHLPIEAQAIDFVVKLTGSDRYGSRADVLAIMRAFHSFDRTLCGTPDTNSVCASYYCRFRGLAPDFDRLCHERVATAPKSQDLVLGLLYGR
ncbi:MAG: hypothetical protein ACT6WE_27210, partial [Shinella sp.]|uniref:hypothetical protein n=1 Tax=Shinella sp. TaxID=1870904 RepID=UPI004034F808